MRNHPDEDDDNNATTTPRSWLGWKQAGRAAYERGDYTEALHCYRTALRPEYECAVTADRQVLLSNIVACRLQLGGQAQAEAAVRDAQQCVALNASWAKGHVRLASAYAALGKSNDACNALQTALRLDPGNRTAREMLVRELRRERVQRATTTNVDDDQDAPPPQNPAYVPHNETPTPSSSTNTTTSRTSAQQRQEGVRIDVDVDEGWTWQDRLRYYQTQVTDWYASQSNEVRNLLKAGLVFLVIYVAFGGRFGLTSSNSNRPLHGNYDQGNAYDQFYQNRASSSSSSNSHAYDHSYRSSSSNSRRNDYYNSHDDYYGNNGYSRRGGGSSYSSYGYSGSSWETSLPSIAMIAGIAYLCHLAGINPLHALLMMNAMGGRRRHRFGGGGFGGGFRRRRRPGAAFYW